MKLIAGLGNPGAAYSLTRHNIGFMAADRLSLETGIVCNEKKFCALIGRGDWCGQEVLIAKPQTFMNRSGEAIQAIASTYAIPVENIIVMHDDMDIAFGCLKIKIGGGSAGHRGISSVIEQLGTDSFLRLRIGIGRPTGSFQGPASAYVLDAFPSHEQNQIQTTTGTICQCVETILTLGPIAAMNRFHTTAQRIDTEIGKRSC